MLTVWRDRDRLVTMGTTPICSQETGVVGQTEDPFEHVQHGMTDNGHNGIAIVSVPLFKRKFSLGDDKHGSCKEGSGKGEGYDDQG